MVYLWQVAAMPNDPLYSKMKVEGDFQFAIDQNEIFQFVKLLESSQDASIVCSALPSSQPHSCDDPSEVWGCPVSIFTKLNIKIEATEKEHGVVKEAGEEITLVLNSSQVQCLIKTIQGAASVPVFFEYEHFFLLKNENGELVKLNVWGWCQNGQIEYAN